ncbi:hypothetical protein B0H66DRAFT_522255 [Apodospora peruviana]|uniref:DUF7730 domain-containing protein n=1 Tax=Apodospora peruviana TaxID=516989 RepID=A0AAE0HVE4_9PEZI|nr:hypothetical protein B0H66DRAFT_522255 [Apodospora peruviana]
MAGFRKWVRTKLGGGTSKAKLRQQQVKGSGEQRQRQRQRQQQQQQNSLPPYLPATRPRPLTPPLQQPSSESSQEDGKATLLQNYGLFSRAPPEIRRQILTEAFGGRTLHMDLTYPSYRSESGPTTKTTHRHCDIGSELVFDTSGRGPQWFSCVCHRRAGYSQAETLKRYAEMEISQTIEPCDDGCLLGSESMCSCSEGDGAAAAAAAACFVGVMGWLLTCRQAYAEGIQVLYGTNTFHISSLDLQLNLPRLVPSHHLAGIRSLELLWKLDTFKAFHGSSHLPTGKEDHVRPLWADPSRRDSALHVLCGLISQTFPHLGRLYISFQCHLHPGSFLRPGADVDIISEVETIFLGPVEDMLRTYYYQVRQDAPLELNVAIQSGAWRVLLAKYHQLLGGAKLRVESADELARGRFWKPLGQTVGRDDDDDDDGGEFGYWICGGWDDMRGLGNDYWNMTNWGGKWMSGNNDVF